MKPNSDSVSHSRTLQDTVGEIVPDRSVSPAISEYSLLPIDFRFLFEARAFY